VGTKGQWRSRRLQPQRQSVVRAKSREQGGGRTRDVQEATPNLNRKACGRAMPLNELKRVAESTLTLHPGPHVHLHGQGAEVGGGR